MNKVAKIILAFLIIVSLVISTLITIAFAEYRIIMENIHPYIGENNTVYLEIFGQVDEYYAEYAEDYARE